MRYRNVKWMTAVSTMAVIFFGLMSGCATKRDAAEIKSQITGLESQFRTTRKSVARMDSLVTSAAESNRQLQNDVRSSTDQLAQQLSQLLENYNDLMTRLDRLSQQPVIRASPGAQSEEPPPSRQPQIDCLDTYDAAFTQTRRGEYEAAIEGFRKFQAECPDHENAESSGFWTGECFYALERYSEAVAELEQLVERFPESANLGRALYKLARCQQELGKKAQAKALYRRLAEEYAGTFEGEKAAEFLEEMK